MQQGRRYKQVASNVNPDNLTVMDYRPFSTKLATLLTSGILIVHGGELKPVAAQVTPDGLTDLDRPAELAPLFGEGHLLGVGDSVRIDVFNIDDYGGDFQVLAGGVVNLPVVGAVTLEGLTLQQAAARIEQQLVSYVRRPRVTVSLLSIRPLQVSISGEVSRPGSYRVDNEENDASSLTQVIELAGGITQLADIRRIEVRRRRSSVAANASLGAGGAGQFQTFNVDLWNLLRTGALEEDVQLQDGDRITIPTAAALNADEIAELASASFSPDEIIVNVVGEVTEPGAVELSPNTPLNQAILAAGGFTSSARTKTVDLIRLNPNGTATEQEVAIDFSQGIDETGNPALRPGDTIVVRSSTAARIGETLGAVLDPLGRVLNIFRIFR